jgi:acyl dehydratase
MKYWDDLSVGSSFKTGTITIDAAAIIEYAKDFDPQPYHLDPVVAEKSIFGGHCASGWQVCALMMRLFIDTLRREGIPTAGSTGVESLRWYAPVFANDTLHATIDVLKLTRPDDQSDRQSGAHGEMHCTVCVYNQLDARVIKLDTCMLVPCQPERADNVGA